MLRADAEDPPAPTRTAGREPENSRRSARLSLILRALGTLCLVAALAVGGFLGWQLWGTGIGTAREQQQLRREITEQIARPRPIDPQTKLPARAIPEGAPIGIIRIPRIGLDMVVVSGTRSADLKKGPGHYIDSAYPWEDAGKVAIAGHRTTYRAPFGALDKLRPGDLIQLVTEHGTFDYRVTGSRVILPTGVWVLKQTSEPSLVLTTCTPRYSASHRLVIFASR